MVIEILLISLSHRFSANKAHHILHSVSRLESIQYLNDSSDSNLKIWKSVFQKIFDSWIVCSKKHCDKTNWNNSKNQRFKENMTNGNMFFVFVLTLTFAVNINGQGQLISLPTENRVIFSWIIKIIVRRLLMFSRVFISHSKLLLYSIRCEYRLNWSN